MSVFEDSKPEPLPKCGVCRKPALFQVWGTDCCIECHGSWMGDDRFTSGAIDKALGLKPPSKPGDLELVVNESRKRMAQWVKERRAR